MLHLEMDHWNFTDNLKKKRKEVELTIQRLLLPDSEAGKVGVKFQFPDSRVSKLWIYLGLRKLTDKIRCPMYLGLQPGNGYNRPRVLITTYKLANLTNIYLV